jgi:hypothetical protein
MFEENRSETTSPLNSQETLHSGPAPCSRTKTIKKPKRQEKPGHPRHDSSPNLTREQKKEIQK